MGGLKSGSLITKLNEKSDSRLRGNDIEVH
jgi:hypothetical protein